MQIEKKVFLECIVKGASEKIMFGQFNPNFFFYVFPIKPCYIYKKKILRSIWQKEKVGLSNGPPLE